MQAAEQLCVALSRRLGLHLQPDAQASCAINFDDEVHVQASLDDAQQAIALCAGVGSIPGHAKAAIQRVALRANLMPAMLQGAHFAIDPGTGDLLLCLLLPADESTDADRVVDAMGVLVRLCRQWRPLLADAGFPLA